MCLSKEQEKQYKEIFEEVMSRPESQAIIAENKRTRPPPPPPNGREMCQKAKKHIAYFWCGFEMCPRCGIMDGNWPNNKKAPDGLPWGPYASPERWQQLPSVNT